MFLCPLTSGHGRGRRVPPFIWTFLDDKTFLENLRENSTAAIQGKGGNCQRCPLPPALFDFIPFQNKRGYTCFQGGHLLPQLFQAHIFNAAEPKSPSLDRLGGEVDNLRGWWGGKVTDASGTRQEWPQPLHPLAGFSRPAISTHIRTAREIIPRERFLLTAGRQAADCTSLLTAGGVQRWRGQRGGKKFLGHLTNY